MNTNQDLFKAILDLAPQEWLELTTHRLDIYDESQAKYQFLQELEKASKERPLDKQILSNLPTAYDYVRLGHQLSSVLEWAIADINQVSSDQVVTFASKAMPILGAIRTSMVEGNQTYIYDQGTQLPISDKDLLRHYGYNAKFLSLSIEEEIPSHEDGLVVLITQAPLAQPLKVSDGVDITVNVHQQHGSAVIIHSNPRMSQERIDHFVRQIQHVRRRESIAATPIGSYQMLQEVMGQAPEVQEPCSSDELSRIEDSISQNSGSHVKPLIATSGLSIQYAILMGLIHQSRSEYPDKKIDLIIPPNCYGGTNDQARRIAQCLDDVSVVDLPVDGGKDMVSSLKKVLQSSADRDHIPVIMVEIPTNPRVEIPHMESLAIVLKEERTTQQGATAVAPFFIVDQTFCPNVSLLQEASPLADIKVLSFVSGSKFPSGGKCTAGYCLTNAKASTAMSFIKQHLELCDNSATQFQLKTLAKHMPSMPERIQAAYLHTKAFTDHIKATLPTAKINFVSEELASIGFTPSAFSLDLPSYGDTEEEREKNKRILNQKLIDHMIKEIPECKYCVSYGQLKGSYWTIPATSTQGTTKEHDKDYIVRAAFSPDLDIEKHKTCFTQFCHKESLV